MTAALEELTRAALDFAGFLESTPIVTQLKVENMSKKHTQCQRRNEMVLLSPPPLQPHYRLRKNNVWRIILHHLKSFSGF